MRRRDGAGFVQRSKLRTERVRCPFSAYASMSMSFVSLPANSASNVSMAIAER